MLGKCFILDWIYVLVSSVMSLSLVAVIYVLISRKKNSSAIFSAALGIIIFRCVKSIFAECGWGFAAIFGVFSGIAAQVTVFAASFVFFHELGEDEFIRKFRFNVSQIFMLLSFGLGKNLLYNYTELSDVMMYILGEATDFALILLSIEAASDDFREKGSTAVICRAAIILIVRAVILIFYRNMESDKGSFVPLVVLTLGISGMVCEFARAMRSGRDISAAGFAAGITLSFCFDSLMG